MSLGLKALNPLLAANLWQFNPPAYGVRYSAAYFLRLIDLSMDRVRTYFFLFLFL